MLEERLVVDFKESMKQKDSIRTATLSFLRAQLKNIAIEKKKDTLNDSDVVAVIKKQVKQRLDSIEKFKSGGRSDLVEKEEKELEILKRYLPEELSKDEVEKIIEEVITQTQASSMKDMGRVMKEVVAKAAGRAESKLVSDLVRSKLMLPKNEGSTSEST